MEKYKGKYRSESHRLQGWDYSQEAIYFITICTENRLHLFGEIPKTNPEMQLNNYGKIVKQEIENSIRIREHWIFHEWIIMPNHIHLLIEITDTHRNVDTHGGAYVQGNRNVDKNNISVDTHGGAYVRENGNVDKNNISVDTHGGAYVQKDVGENDTHGGAYVREIRKMRKKMPTRKPKSISSFVALFKSVTTKQINQLRQTKGERVWLRNYHDHIVRNYASFDQIANYIYQNPQTWHEDIFNGTVCS